MLTNKVIVVAGGSGLIGRSFVESIVENNGIAIIADSNIDAAQQLINKNQWKNAFCISLDINSKQSLASLIKEVVLKHKKIDGFVNCAYPRNKQYGAKFEDVTYESFCENVSLNLGGYFLAMQQMALFFKTQGFGNIVNISSIYGVVAPRFNIYQGTSMTTPVEYPAIKSALIHLTKYVAKYLKGTGIRVNCISPGGIDDAKQPESFKERYNQHGLSKGLLTAKDLTGVLLFLLSDSSKYMNGQNLIVDDGWCL